MIVCTHGESMITSLMLPWEGFVEVVVSYSALNRSADEPTWSGDRTNVQTISPIKSHRVNPLPASLRRSLHRPSPRVRDLQHGFVAPAVRWGSTVDLVYHGDSTVDLVALSTS